MKLLLTLLLPAAILFLAGAGTDEAALREKAASMAAEAQEELGLSAEETTHLRELFFEKLDKTERLTRGVADPAERSQIAKRIHQEFTQKLYGSYNRRTSNKIEGWYYNYTNKK